MCFAIKNSSYNDLLDTIEWHRSALMERESILGMEEADGIIILLTQNIEKIRKKIIDLSHFGNFSLSISRDNRREVVKILLDAAKGDSRLEDLERMIKDLDGAGQELPEIIPISSAARRAILNLNGKTFAAESGEKMKLAVTADPLQFQPGPAWRTYQKYLPFFAAFTPYLHGPTNDSFKQSRLGRILQVVLGILLSPLLLAANLAYLASGGPAWRNRGEGKPIDEDRLCLIRGKTDSARTA